MKRSISSIYSILCISSFLFLGNWNLSAQETSENASSELVVESETIREELEESSDQYIALMKGVRKAKGEDKLVMIEQARELLLGNLEKVEALGEILVNQKAAGLDTEEFEKFMKRLLHKVPKALKQAAEESRDEIERVEVEILKALPVELYALELEKAEYQNEIDDLFDAAVQYLLVLTSTEIGNQELRGEWEKNLMRHVQLTVGRLHFSEKTHEQLETQVKTSPTDTVLAQKLEANQVALDTSVRSLERKIRMLELLGMEVTQYQALIVSTTGQITKGFSLKVIVSLAEGWFSDFWNWVVTEGPGFFGQAVIFVFILIAFRLLSRLFQKAIFKAMDRSSIKPSRLLRHMIANMVGNVIMVMGVLIALSQIGISLGPLLAGLGVMGFIIGFALQETLANFAAGLMILFYRPFDVGDLVEAAGVRGEVNHMSLVSTTILTLDNQTLIVPNGKIWGDVIINVTHQKIRRVDLVFGIGYSDDIPKAEEIMKSILEAHPKVLKDPESNVKLYELADSSVNFIVRPWVKTEDYWDVHWDVTREVKMRFDLEGVGIPFPQRDVHVYYENGPKSIEGGEESRGTGQVSSSPRSSSGAVSDEA